MSQARIYSRVSLSGLIPLFALVLLTLTACTKTTGPKIDKHAVPYKVDKSKAIAKVERKKSSATESKRTKSATKVARHNKSEKLAESIKSTRPVEIKSVATAKVAPTPCNMGDNGYGIYYPWVKNLEVGRMLMPKSGALTADNGFDVMIHFHGGNAVRKMIADTARGIFVVGIDLGAGSSAYGRPFSDPELFRNLLRDIEKSVAEYTKKPSAHIRRLGLTGWSAGYGAIRAILKQKAGKRVDAVVLLDGLHSNYDENNPLGLRASQLRPFVQFAKRAVSGGKFMFVSHSSIVPPGYASTTETAHYLATKLGLKVLRSSAKDSPLLSRYEQAKSGGFLMRGYHGEGKDDHCAQIALITDAVATMEQRWQTPGAKGKRYSRPRPAVAGRLAPRPSVVKIGQHQEQPKSASLDQS
jgi:hypothetical protein